MGKADKQRGQGYWAIVRRQFFQKKLAVGGLVVVVFMFGVATLAPLVANDKPVAASYKGQLYFPAFTTYLDSDAYPIPAVVSSWLRRNISLLAPVWPLEDNTKREAWLTAATKALRPLFRAAGNDAYPKKLQVSCGWPGGGTRSRVGECWAQTCSAKGATEIFISPVVAKPVEVLGILAHELVHAVVGCEHGHKAPFRKLAVALGLTGKMTATVTGPELEVKLKAIAKALGRYPHSELRTWKQALADELGSDTEFWRSSDKGWALMPLVPYGFKENQPTLRKRTPGSDTLEGRGHLLGTDDLGRDVLTRMIYGTIVAMSVGVLSVSIYVILGIIIGALAGYFGGWVDMLISRVIEVVICFPTLFLILAVISIISPSIYPIIILLGLIRWTGPARLIRGEFLKARAADYVIAAQSLGLPSNRIIFRHLVPNCVSPVLVNATFGVAGAILIESSLSFLGFGIAPPMASWGELAKQGREYVTEGMYHLILFPGLATFGTVTAFNLMGEGLRDAMDPRLRE